MKARYIGIIFVAAVMVPSVLLSVLSIRSAGREEAYIEKQLTTTLLAEVTHAASLVSSGVSGIAAELHASAPSASGQSYEAALLAWKRRNPLVGVPYLLSAGNRILWPPAESSSGEDERMFLQLNSDFLSGKAATPVFANIAVVHKEQVLAEARRLDESLRRQETTADVKSVPTEKTIVQELARPEAGAGAQSEAAAPTRSQAAAPAESQEPSAPEGSPALEPPSTPGTPSSLGAPAAPRAPSAGGTPSSPEESATRDASSVPESLESQRAIDTFEQNPAVQARVYKKAQAQGEQLNARVAQPTSKAFREAPAAASESQYITTSRLMSQIASQGEYGIIPRFIGEKLTFLFWSRQGDGRIIGCQIASAAFRLRIAGILPSTYSPVRILTVLDESGTPLATPPGAAPRDWRRPFVSQEIGESLPRWEAASYLTDPGSISAQARSASAVIWILVLILFVSVAGGGTMVLTSLYGEMRLAQKKASFVAGVSHELKTPLTSISLFIDLLRRSRRTDPRKRDRYLALMAAETERLGRLINNVLDFSSLEKGRKRYSKRRVDLARIASEVVEGQRVRLEGLGFTVLCEAAERVFVDADPEAMKQVLINLVSNGEKYSPEQKEIQVVVVREEAVVAAHVRDRGIGVAESDRERIFLEFVRVDDSLSARVPGTGLGLTIARRIARDHGGNLTCAGRDGGGSDFVLELPAASGDLEEQE